MYSSNIAKVRFEISGTEDVERNSYAQITSYELFRNGKPSPGGVYDGHLGTTDYSYRCQTCLNGKKNCIGHAGHLVLNYPVQSPLFLGEIRKWLKLICFRCGQPILDDSQFIRLPKSKRLDEAGRLARIGNRKCYYCGEIHPVVSRDKNEPLATYAETYRDKVIEERYKLYPHEIGKILSRISNETVIKLGKHVASHPSKYILRSICVPSTVIRPDVKKVGGGRSTNDDLTTLIQYMIKKNETIPAVFEEVDSKLDKAIYELGNAYYDFIKGGGAGKRVITSGSQPLNSLALRLRGKFGRFRKTLMGKRIRQCGRSTITGDPMRKINEVGVPLKFARILQIEETVQEYNKQRLMIYFNNGRAKYPGCTKIVKKTGAEHGIENVKDDFDLEIGDKIHRDLITGDVLTFNRQPSLKPSNISCMNVVVLEDPEILTLTMNVMACPLFDGDFNFSFHLE